MSIDFPSYDYGTLFSTSFSVRDNFDKEICFLKKCLKGDFDFSKNNPQLEEIMRVMANSIVPPKPTIVGGIRLQIVHF